MTSPYHDGELAVQRLAGERDAADRNGRAIGSSIMPGALKFVGARSMAVAAGVGDGSEVWASLLSGPPGFARALSTKHVEVDTPWRPTDSRLGLLFIDFATRRRLRVNGTTARSDHVLYVDVHEAYPNCPKYIQRRTVLRHDAPTTDNFIESTDPLGDEQRRLIADADTFFVASHHPSRGVDASHRGGRPGFAQLLTDGRTLRVPDYAGNRMFNTLGNVAVDPRVGLLFMDLNDRVGRVLQLTGTASLDFIGPAEGTGGTNRWWTFATNRWRYRPAGSPLRWSFVDSSPLNP